MKRGLLVIGVVFLLSAGTAEAGVLDWAKNSVSYLWSPVNCVANLAVDIGQALWGTVQCVLKNANRVPTTLDPLITIH